MGTIPDSAAQTVTLARDEPNEWARKMDAVIEERGVDAALGQAYADGMAFVCHQLGHPVAAGDGSCLCGGDSDELPA